MDVFQIDSSNISSTISDGPERSDDITDVKFEAHSEFDLNFFETPDDSMTQCSVFSNPNSVESIEASPEPLTPSAVLVSSTSSSNGTTANVVNIKIGKKSEENFFPFCGSQQNFYFRVIHSGFSLYSTKNIHRVTIFQKEHILLLMIVNFLKDADKNCI
jgi:hypothetical protein